MFRSATKTLATGALALNTAISPAAAFGHKGDQDVEPATYRALIAKMPQGAARTQLEGYASLVADYAVACKTANHSPELESQLNGMMTDLKAAMDEAGLVRPAEQTAAVEADLAR